ILRTRIVGAGGAIAVATIAIVVGLTIRSRARHELEAVIDDQAVQAKAAFDDARRLAQQRDAARDRPGGVFRARRWTEGEDAWNRVEALAAREASQFRAASGHFESALAVDSTRTALREQFADLLFARLVRAERDREPALAEELAGRLAAY